MLAGQLAAYLLVRTEPFYTPPVIDPGSKNIANFENTSVFSVSVFQYIALCLAFSQGRPYRQSIRHNGALSRSAWVEVRYL
jgi:cation-transporting ATPase 13A3/4/5